MRVIERDAQLQQTLAKIAEAKASVKTPVQAAAAMTAALPQLPEPIEIQMPGYSNVSAGATEESSGTKTATSGKGDGDGNGEGAVPAPAIAKIPQADLKPLFDAAEDCRACQFQLAAAKADLADESAKLTATAAERDAALKAAKTASAWARIRRAAKWFIIGAAAGAMAAKSAR